MEMRHGCVEKILQCAQVEICVQMVKCPLTRSIWPLLLCPAITPATGTAASAANTFTDLS